MSGILPAERAIIDLLHANANEYVTLSSDIAGSTTYVVNNIQIVNRRMEKNEKLVTFVKDVEQKKKSEQKIVVENGNHNGVLYYIPNSEYSSILSSNSDITTLSSIELNGDAQNNRITAVNYNKLVDVYERRNQKFGVNDKNSTVVKNEPQTSLTQTQIDEINKYLAQIQAKLNAFNTQDSERKKKHTDLDKDKSDNQKQNEYKTAHKNALETHIICDRMIESYDEVLKDLSNNKMIDQRLNKTKLKLPKFDILSDIIISGATGATGTP
jgi:septal ring factor EnvC (AmiA/AmiB activator)